MRFCHISLGMLRFHRVELKISDLFMKSYALVFCSIQGVCVFVLSWFLLLLNLTVLGLIAYFIHVYKFPDVRIDLFCLATLASNATKWKGIVLHYALPFWSI